MPIRMLALDLDGTVLLPTRDPHPVSAAMIRAAHERGVRIVLASGRMTESVARIREMIGVPAAIVGLNGAQASDHEGNVILAQYVGDRATQAIITLALETGVHISLYDEEGVRFAHDSVWGRRYTARVKGIDPRIYPEAELRAGRYYKLLFADDAKAIPEHRARAEALLDPKDVTLTESESEYLEFLPAGTDKGLGVAKVAEYYGIGANEVAAIGDYLNDLEMLRWVGVSGAMGNGHPDILQAANFTVGTNEEGGVAQFIEQYVLQP
ncbi:MAG: hypothetical protein C4320_01565 [Armatimonadota bacterium]